MEPKSCKFETGSGSITLTLPADADVKVDLDTGAGTINVAFAVDGDVSERRVKGTIGVGDEGSIRAHTGSGSIDVIKK